jgi:hypothetical protein
MLYNNNKVNFFNRNAFPEENTILFVRSRQCISMLIIIIKVDILYMKVYSRTSSSVRNNK